MESNNITYTIDSATAAQMIQKVKAQVREIGAAINDLCNARYDVAGLIAVDVPSDITAGGESRNLTASCVGKPIHFVKFARDLANHDEDNGIVAAFMTGFSQVFPVIKIMHSALLHFAQDLTRKGDAADADLVSKIQNLKN